MHGAPIGVHVLSSHQEGGVPLNTLEALSLALAHLEDHIRENTDEQAIARISQMSFPMFCRMFSMLTGYSLGDYLRRRRLTLAMMDLEHTSRSILEIALDWGYESADGFTAAFKDVHGCTPSSFRKGHPGKVFAPMTLNFTLRGGYQMNTTIVTKPAFQVAGVRRNAIDTTQCSTLWKELFHKASEGTLAAMGSGEIFGVCIDTASPDTINYMACYDVKDMEKAHALGLEVLSIPEARYMVLHLKGAVPGCIHEGWRYALETAMPQQGVRHAGTPDMEYYYPGNMNSPDYRMELWIPIVTA